MGSAFLYKKKLFLSLLFSLIAGVGSAGSLHAGTKTDGTWRSFESQTAIVSYTSIYNVAKFNESVFPGLDAAPTEESHAVALNRIAFKIDQVYEQVKTILGFGGRLPKANIILFSNENRLNLDNLRIQRKGCGVQAWYVFVTNTIYLNADDVNAGILAHELAHSIIDGHLLGPPSSATAEAMAQYAEKRLTAAPFIYKRNVQ